MLICYLRSSPPPGHSDRLIGPNFWAKPKNRYFLFVKGNCMDLNPDFERFRKAAKRCEPDRVPLCEVLIDYSVMSRFLGREVKSDDLASQVEFWSKAGYDYIPIPVSLMSPGKVTEESKITRLLKEMVLKKTPQETGPKSVEFGDEQLYPRAIRHGGLSLGSRPGEIEYGKLDAVEPLLPSKMKVIVITGKIFYINLDADGLSRFCVKEPH